MTDSLLPRYEEPKQTLSWPRIAGTSFAIALHVVVFMTLMAPVTPAQKAEEDEDVTLVSFIEPPPPPPPEPPKVINKVVDVPVPTPVPPPPEEPPVVYDEPSPVATPAPPPAPPAPVSAPADFEGGEIDPTGRSMNPPVYPREEQRRGITGTVSLLLTYDANGTVTQVDVIKSSGNRNLDRAARVAAMKWKVNPGMRGGVKVAGKAKTDVDFVLN